MSSEILLCGIEGCLFRVFAQGHTVDQHEHFTSFRSKRKQQLSIWDHLSKPILYCSYVWLFSYLDFSLIWIRDNASVEMLQSKKNDQHAYRIRNTLKNNILSLISLDLKPRAKLSNIQQCCLCMCKRTQQLPTITACVCCTGLQLRCTIYKLYINRCMQ